MVTYLSIKGDNMKKVPLITALTLICLPFSTFANEHSYYIITCNKELNLLTISNFYSGDLELKKERDLEGYKMTLKENSVIEDFGSKECSLNDAIYNIEVKDISAPRNEQSIQGQCGTASKGEVKIYANKKELYKVPFTGHCSSTPPLLITIDQYNISHCHPQSYDGEPKGCVSKSLLQLKKSNGVK